VDRGPRVKPQPHTALTIKRLGNPIPFPTTIEEYREQLIWALSELHDAHNQTASYPGPITNATLQPDTAVAPQCRMAVALLDYRFTCPDPWHLVYQPGNDACPSCALNWIATVRT
jgi:hypothetical protein